MAFYKSFQTNNYRILITKDEARLLISEVYSERNADRHMETLIRDKSFGLGYWLLHYEPTLDTYCEDQGCQSIPENCGYYPVNCMRLKYNVIKKCSTCEGK